MTPTEHAEAILKAIDWATLGAYRPEPFPAILAAVEAAMQDARAEALELAAVRAEQIAECSNTSGFNSCCESVGEDIAVAIRDLAHKGAGDA